MTSVERMLSSSIRTASTAIRTNQISIKQLINQSIQQCKTINQTTNAFTHIDEKASIHESASESNSQLYGLPISIKANFNVQGWRTDAASAVLSTYVSPVESTVVTRLKNAGSVLVAQTNMDEFGMGSNSLNSVHGPVSQSNDQSNNQSNNQSANLTAGGSSGGAAVSVSTNCVYAALGSDTGGSVRLPAAMTGQTGFKPTYGALSRYGLIAYGSSLDTPGLIARDVTDIRTVFDAVVGQDARDPTSININPKQTSPSFDHTIALPLKGVTVGLPLEANIAELSDATRASWLRCIRIIERLGGRCVTVNLPTLMHALPAYYIVASAEASSNLSRYDGIKYGASVADSKQLNSGISLADYITANRSSLFGSEVQRRLLVGSFVLSSSSHKQYFEKAQQIRGKLATEFKSLFNQSNNQSIKQSNNQSSIDFLLQPVNAQPPHSIEQIQKGHDSNSSFVNDALTVASNLVGVPAIAFSASNRSEMNIGMQLIAPWKQDFRLLDMAEIVQTHLQTDRCC